MEGTGQPAPEYRQNEFMVYATIRLHGDVVTTEKTTEKILSLILENPNKTTEELARSLRVAREPELRIQGMAEARSLRAAVTIILPQVMMVTKDSV